MTISQQDLTMKGTIRKYAKYNVEILRLVGLWTDADGIFETKYYWIYYLFVTICCVGLFNLTQFIYILTVIDDLEEVANAACLFLICIMANVKGFFFLQKFKLFRRVLDRLDKEDFQPRNEEQMREMDTNMFIYVWAQIVFGVIIVFMIPLWLYGPQVFSEEEKPLPFRVWYPYNSSDSTMYVVSYLHQSIGILTVGFINIPVDLVTVGLIAYVGAECDILSNTLRNLREFTRKRLQKQRLEKGTGSGGENEKVVQIERLVTTEDEEEEVAEEMNNTLLDCVQHHRRILKFAEDVNEMFNAYVFVLFATSLLAICLTLFMLSVAKVGSGESIVLTVYEIGVFYELLIYCYFGNDLIVKSDGIAFALYECSWFDCPPSFKKNMIFFILRTNLRPMKMMGVKFFVLSLPSFTAIMRSAWSFFMMLHQMHNERNFASLPPDD